jgi:hypothetical protein
MKTTEANRRAALTAASLGLLLAFPFAVKAAPEQVESSLVPAKKALKSNRLPVREVTIFKDGHALLRREGSVPLSASGDVVLTDLPTPLLGTFFPYSLENEPLISVTAGREKSEKSQTALTIAELIEANPGAAVTIARQSGHGENRVTSLITGKLAASPLPTRSIDELNKMEESSTTSGAEAAVKSTLVEIQTGTGSTFLPVGDIESLTFADRHEAKVHDENLKDVLKLRLAGNRRLAAGAPSSTEARVGMIDVEQGLRWIPDYKISLDGKGHARLKLQATLVNDLIDLDDVETQLVVGVPSFIADGENDPIALRKTLSDVTNRLDQNSAMRSAFSNAIMTQTVGYDRGRSSSNQNGQSETTAGGGDGPGSEKHEDLFVYNLKHISLKRGERMVVPVAECTVPYEDLYVLDLPLKPPLQVARSGMSGGLESDLNKENELKIAHKIRFKNDSNKPFTTAPALLIDSESGREVMLAQSLIPYASPGGTSDVTLTTAVDLKATRSENEVSRQEAGPHEIDAGNKYARINLEGLLTVTNLSGKSCRLEVSRKIVGHVDSTSDNGDKVMLSAMNESEAALPAWWNYYAWPSWWSQMNGLGKFTFKSEIAPRQTARFAYKWHYFWR